MPTREAESPTGIVSYGVHVPYWRLDRAEARAMLGIPGGKGTRAVASFDEDTTTMGVAAARRALTEGDHERTPRSLWFATTQPAYLDKTNAVAIREALHLPAGVEVTDVVGSVRSGLGALRAALATQGLLILSDVRTGMPGSEEELSGGDAAVAFTFGSGPAVIACLLASATSTGEFLDRWRAPGQSHSQVWEERFGEVAYADHVAAAWEHAFATTGLQAEAIDHVIVTGLHARARAAATRTLGVGSAALAEDHTAVIGNSGTAHWGVMLADVLERATPSQTIAVVTLADGASVQLWRTTDALAARPRTLAVRDQITLPGGRVPYPRFLTWRGFLDREPPRRPEPDRPAAPPTRRSAAWKFGLVGSADESGFVHAPPSRVSLRSRSVDQMTPVALSDRAGRIATFTVDRLAYSLSPPVAAAVVDFDGGGRFPFELTDVDPEQLRIGDPVELTFRRLYTQGGVHDYFWKVRPVAGEPMAKVG